MGIQIQCCGLAIILLLLFFYFRQKRVGLYTESIFLRILMISLMNILLDIGSMVAIHFSDNIPTWLLYLACKGYIVSVVWMGESAVSYVLVDILTEKQYLWKKKILVAVTCIESVIVFLLPIYIHQQSDGVYTYGAAVSCTYVFCLLHICLAAGCMIKNRSKMIHRRRFVVFTWLALWLVAAIIQFFNDQLLVVGFASALGMMIIFLALENPESNIDKQLGCFHTHALSAYLEQCFSREQDMGIMLLSMTVIQPMNVSEAHVHESICQIVNYLDRNKNVKVFKNLEQELVIVCPDMTTLANVFRDLQEKFYHDQFYAPKKGERESYEFPNTLFLLIPHSRIFRKMDEVFQLFQQIKIENRDITSSSVCYVNAQYLTEVRKKKEMQVQIIQALDEDRVEAFFQPIYSTKAGKIVSAEALARIMNPDGTILSPGQFIPIAEESGLIGQLGERIFEKTCEFLQNSKAVELGIHYIEVNLSVVQCEQRNLADRYIEIMKQYHIEPWMINLEITETASVQTKKNLLENMKKLIDYGVSFSLDDFGNGQSNLDYVIDMPISVMKLDMNMTHAYFQDLKARFVVQATIQMAHDMDLFLVSEGVETKEQLLEMEKQSVDYIQGYYFSKPLPPNEFILFLEQFISNGHFVDK